MTQTVYNSGSGTYVNLDISSGNSSVNGGLGVGYTGSATLNIATPVVSKGGYLGVNTFSTGWATVTGSSWTMSSDLHVGQAGGGILSIAGAGTVSNVNGAIAGNSSAGGTVSGASPACSVTVDGGSLWKNTGI